MSLCPTSLLVQFNL